MHIIRSLRPGDNVLIAMPAHEMIDFAQALLNVAKCAYRYPDQPGMVEVAWTVRMDGGKPETLNVAVNPT